MDWHSILAELFPYFVLMYAADCVVILRPYQAVIATGFFGRVRQHTSRYQLVGLWPHNRVFVTDELPVYFAADGVYYVPSQDDGFHIHQLARSFDFTSYDDLTVIAREGKKVYINGTLLTPPATTMRARRLTENLVELRKSSAEERKKLSEKLQKHRFHDNEVEAQVNRSAALTTTIESASILLFACFFMVLPTKLYGNMNAAIELPLLLWVCLGLYGFVGLLAVWLYLLWFGRAGLAMLLAQFFLTPFSAMHILSHVTRQRFTGFPTITIAAALMSAERLAPMLRSRWHSLRQALGGELAGSLRKVFEKEVELMGALAKKFEVDLKLVPQRDSDDCLAFCPVCNAQVIRNETKCPDCSANMTKF